MGGKLENLGVAGVGHLKGVGCGSYIQTLYICTCLLERCVCMYIYILTYIYRERPILE